jgi:YegS/Rv2252/BmrU family lipid kinase
MGKRVVVILNSGAGRAGDDDIEKTVISEFERAGCLVTIRRVRSGEELISTAQDSATDCDVIVAAGGDGTISAVASVAIQEEKVLGVLPLGTLNHFSKDLGIPQEVAGAVDVIARANIRQVDIAEVNGRYFINNSSIGLYPRLVRTRERRQSLGHGKWWAALWALTRIVRRYPFQNIKLQLDDNELQRKTPFLFVGNNVYEMDLYNIGARPRLDEGKLCIYLLRRSGRTGLLLLILRTLFGGLRRDKNFEEFRTTKLRVETRKSSMLVALDGEVAAMDTPLEYKIHPGELKVIVPRDKEQR